MQLGYIGFEVTDVDAWTKLGTDVIGLMPAGENSDGSSSFRMDDCQQRLFVREGPADDVCALGLCAASTQQYEATLTRLTANHVAFETMSAAAANARGVERLVRVSAPYDTPIEFATPLRLASTPYTSRYSGEDWLTGELGVGHALLRLPDKDVMAKFLVDCFGFRFSNTGNAPWNGHDGAQVAFMNCNARHHSLALATVGERLPQLAGHFMLERKKVDGVGLTFDRVRKAGLHVTNGIGRHTDGSLTFYTQTPSGFDFEIGAESFLIDDDWKVYELSSYSLWGHEFQPARLLS
ncbi:MAG: VOC family protein [Proteobacteria bacterium]|nr:VOC family protein [Pseudomonadota bacterium]